MSSSDISNKHQIGGDHYRRLAVQPWTAMENWMSEEEFTGFLRGAAIKHIARFGTKEGNTRLQDVQKAQHYLSKLEEILKSGKNSA